MKDAPLRAAVIGCGRMGVFTSEKVQRTAPAGWMPLSHADALDSLDAYELVALCDPDRDRLNEAGEKFSISARFTDHRELLGQVRPDVVTIATRTDVRARIMRDAASAGVRGIHAEKPIARSVKEWRETAAELHRHNVKLTWGALRRWHETFRRAHEEVRRDETGAVREISVEFGPGLLLWVHPHSVDLLIQFAGRRPVEVRAQCEIDRSALKGDLLDQDPVVQWALVTFENDTVGRIGTAAGMNLRIGCENATVTVHGDGASLERRLRSRVPGPYFSEYDEQTFAPQYSAAQRALLDLAQAVHKNASTEVTSDEIEWGQRLLTGIVLSGLEEGRAIALDSIPEAFTITGRLGEMIA
ncbi:hypothetical protein GF324_01295 [bacterium]|nr:hypothetical protein [bacterium]